MFNKSTSAWQILLDVPDCKKRPSPMLDNRADKKLDSKGNEANYIISSGMLNSILLFGFSLADCISVVT